ncbi:MAG: T9SS type A sorting domain-containing protein, partial [Bacteroidota bacterium]
IHMPSAAFHFAMAPDRSGGVYVSWQEYRYGRICVFGQHFDASGQRLWRADGYPVITSNNQYTSTPCTGGSCDDLDIVITDAGASGFVAAWGDNRTGPHTWGTYAAKADGLLPTSIDAPSAGKLSASLAPVPAHNLLQVQIAELFAQQDICYSIYDLRGACVQETRKLDTKQTMIDVSQLSSGFYLLRLSSGDRDLMLRWMKF